MYHVLFGVGEDEPQAEKAARELVALPGVDEMDVTVLHCFEEGPGGDVESVPSVGRALEVLGDAGVEASVREANGDPAQAIIDAAVALNADLVLIGGRRRSPAGKALFGSVSQTVILNVPQPVFVVTEPRVD